MHKYHSNGVITVPEAPAPQDNVHIYYNGLLPKSGASEIYAHFTFDQDWSRVKDAKMTKYNHLGPNAQSLDDAILTFHTDVQIPPYAKTLDICFKDSANHWDNNSGYNYSIQLGHESSFRLGRYNPAKTTEDFSQMEYGDYTFIEQAENGHRSYRYPNGT